MQLEPLGMGGGCEPARRRILGLLAATVATGLDRAALAQASYPERHITLVMPFAAGGGPDVTGRLQAIEMSRVLGVSVTVDNRPGAGGSVAAQMVARVAPDGYTVILGASSHLINKLSTPTLGFSPLDDFDHVSLSWRAPSILVVSPASPYADAAALVTAIRSRPGAFSYGSGGVGTVAHLAGGAFARVLALDAVHVPYRGSVDIVPALLRGDVQFAFPIASTAMPAITQRMARPLAVTGAQRLASLPQVPTLIELYADPLLEQDAWGGLWLPRGAPRPVIERLFSANETVLRLPSVESQFEAQAVMPVISESPAAFSAFIAKENDKWRRVLALLGLQPS